MSFHLDRQWFDNIDEFPDLSNAIVGLSKHALNMGRMQQSKQSVS